MNKAFFKFLILNSAFLILLSAACGRKKEAPPVESGPPPTISSLTMKNLASEFPGVIRTADDAGKVQLILFLRSDDPACRGSIADWNRLQKDFADRGFALVGAVVDDRPVAKVAAEVAGLGASFPIGLADSRIVDVFGGPSSIRAIPTAFLLGRDGLVARTYAGHEPFPALRDDLSRVLDGQTLPPRDPKTGKITGAAP